VRLLDLGVEVKEVNVGGMTFKQGTRQVAQDGREALVGIDLASASGYPAWQAPVPDELVGQAPNCDLAQDVLDCGDLLSIDLATGVNRASEPSAREEGLGFAIREGGRTVGSGRVTKVIK